MSTIHPAKCGGELSPAAVENAKVWSCWLPVEIGRDAVGVESIGWHPVGVGNDAVAHGPVGRLDRLQVEEHILATQEKALVQLVHDGLVEVALLLRGGTVEEGPFPGDSAAAYICIGSLVCAH